MNRVVIDTNVIVSSTILNTSKPAQIMDLFFTGKLELIYSVNILSEYKRVLAYKRLNIDFNTQIGLLDAIEKIGILIEPTASNFPMIDETDRVFYDTAKHSGSILITGNLKHYPAEPFVMSPLVFLNHISGVM